MAKGSQLTQLKSALTQAGLTHHSQNGGGKKRKRSGSVLDDKEKERRAAKLREIQEKMNPFDVKVTKLKHDVGGRNIAGTVGRPAQSKQAGIEQRKKTLLKEYEERDRAGGIVDRRFGENDPTMTPEERMLERFTKERQRASKGSAFNLEDEDELTHYGQSLSKLDDFDRVGMTLNDSDEDEGMLDQRTVSKSHFGGFEDENEDDEEEEDEPERKKTKAEVMAEVIAKSKEHKIIRQTQQDEDEALRHELDQELDSIRSLLYAPDPTASTSTSKDADAPPPGLPLESAVTKIDEKDNQYDQFVRELAFEKRAKPTNRTKTEEEVALEEKEALEKAEKQRVRRMNGEEGESDEEEEGGRKKGKKRERGGDDLEDDFMDEDEPVLGAGLGDAAVDMDEDEDDEDDDEDDEDEGGDDEDDSEESEEAAGMELMVSDEEDEEDESEDDGEHEELVKSSQKRSKKKTVASSKELPFTFPCPTSHDEFLEIVEDISDDDVPTVVKRIRTLHHPSLAEDNKFKLQASIQTVFIVAALSGVLIDHVLHVTAPPTPRSTLLSSLIPHIYALSKSYPIQSAEHFISKLTLMQKNLTRGLAHSVTSEDSRTWPGPSELSLLRIVSIVWPTSDMNHAVVNPARLLMGSYLGLCRIRSLQDIASGLFLCTLFLQYEELSKRLVPEAINFLANSLLHLAPHKFKDVVSLPGGFPAPDLNAERLSSLRIVGKKAKSLAVQKPDLTSFFGTGPVVGEQSKVNLLGMALELLGRFADMYKGLEGFVELYQPVLDIMQGITAASLPQDLQTKLTSTKDILGCLLKFATQARKPLRLQAHKPIPIPSYIPKFEQHSSNYLRNRDPDSERNEAAKLRAQYKQERKGAIRELRKDAKFLAAEAQKKQKAKDKTYSDRMNKVMASMESERAEQKAAERDKEKEKRRAGRK
ncbi:nucleolar complex protein 14 [Steccherinum ochraceum]|uniref:Nucleolar complex protein 14 n=1 Tax=Steccherinum ochraceum TaxID=92696 RepID=A0A4R0RWL0_9APHY|nr:nucleolar complex protein 14 [Steccherinum ochraceum]